RHHAQELESEVGRQYRCNVTGAIEDWRDFNDVAANERQTRQPANQLESLVAGQPADLGRAGAGRERGIDAIDVEGHVGRPGGEAADIVDQGGHTALLDSIDVDHRDAVLGMKLKVLLAVHRPANANLNESTAVHQTLFDRAAEWRPMEVLAAEILIPR